MIYNIYIYVYIYIIIIYTIWIHILEMPYVRRMPKTWIEIDSPETANMIFSVLSSGYQSVTSPLPEWIARGAGGFLGGTRRGWPTHQWNSLIDADGTSWNLRIYILKTHAPKIGLCSSPYFSIDVLVEPGLCHVVTIPWFRSCVTMRSLLSWRFWLYQHHDQRWFHKGDTIERPDLSLDILRFWTTSTAHVCSGGSKYLDCLDILSSYTLR